MNIHEYQAKDLLKKYGVAVQTGIVADTPEKAVEAAKELQTTTGTKWVVVKSQIHAGGRGKGIIHDTTTREVIELYGKPVRGVTVIHEGDIAGKAKEYAQAKIDNVDTRAAAASISKKKWCC